MGALLLGIGPGFGGFVVPTDAQADIAVGPNFERFDGLDVPDTNPAAVTDGSPRPGDNYGDTPRPGGTDQQEGQVYTQGALKGLTNTLGGQPLPVNDWKFRGRRTYTPGKTNSIQHRLGDGQNNGGAAQTVTLSQITGNPPIPGDLSGIIAGQG
jgi:hypothetical protein